MAQTVHLPRLWTHYRDIVDHTDPDHANKAVQELFRNFRPMLLVATMQKYAERRSLPADAWQLRDAFLRVAPNSRSALAFLNRWGRWTLDSHTQLAKLVNFQKTVRQALISSPDEWLIDEFVSGLDSLKRTDEYPYFRMETVECEPAIRATVTIDLLRKARFDTCARPDCGQPFAITSNHRRRYCTQYCGHLESVRRSRAAQRRLHRKK
jgi:hypothetical protein